MDRNKILGAIILVVGVLSAAYGFNLQNSFGAQLASVFGQKDNSATAYIIFGAIAAIVGIVLLSNKRGGGKSN